METENGTVQKSLPSVFKDNFRDVIQTSPGYIIGITRSLRFYHKSNYIKQTIMIHCVNILIHGNFILHYALFQSLCIHTIYPVYNNTKSYRFFPGFHEGVSLHIGQQLLNC